MQKSYFSILLMVLLVFSGCGGGNSGNSSGGGNGGGGSTPTPTPTPTKLPTQAYGVYQRSIDAEINKVLPDYTSHFNQDINDSMSSSEENISDATRDLLLKSMLDGFKNDGTQAIRKDIGVGLATKYAKLCKDEGIELNVTEAEEQDINKSVEDYFDNTMTQGYVKSLLSPVAERVASSILNTNQVDQDRAIKNARKVGSFNHLMHGLFENYDENETKNDSGNNYGGSIDGGIIYGKNRVTDTFEEKHIYNYKESSSKMVWRHTIHQPYFKNGNLELNTTTRDYDDDIFNGNEVKANTSADMDGDGYESLIIATCDKNDKSITQFYEVGSRKEDYKIKPIFKDDYRIDCASISDIVSGDFDGDGRDELAVASKNGVHIFDDAQNGYVFMTKHIEHTGYSTGNTYRLVSKNVAGKSYDDLGVVAYNSQSNSTYKAKAYLFEMSGMAYKSNGVINRDYSLYTLNDQELDDTTPADVVMADLEGIGRPKMYVIQLKKSQDLDQDYDNWKENNTGTGYHPDNHWCTYKGSYKNYVDLWSANDSSQGFNKVGSVTIINRIGKTYNVGSGSCISTSQDAIYKVLTNGRDGYLFSTIEKIDAIGYKKSNSDSYDIVLNGLPLNYFDFEGNAKYEVSDRLYGNRYYTANSINSIRPTKDKDDTTYDDTESLKHDYINGYIDEADHDSFFYNHSSIDKPADHYGNRDASAAHHIATIFSLGGGKNQIIYDKMTYPNDSLIMKYVKHNVLYTDPQVLIYLSAPPVKAGQISTFIYTTGSCDKTSENDSESTGLTGGLSFLVGVAIDIPMVNQDSVKTGFSAKYKWTKGHSDFSANSRCVHITDTITSDYSKNLNATDKVKISSEVIDSYVYKIVDDLNDKTNIGHEVTVNDTRTNKFGQKVHYQVWKNIGEYYKILKDNNKTFYIDFSKIITHTPGKIKTYNSLDQYKSLAKLYASTQTNGYNYSNYFATGSYQVQQDSNSNTEAKGYSISDTTGKTIKEDNSYSFSLITKVSAKGGLVIEGASEGTFELGWSHSNSIAYSTSHTSSKSYKFKASGSTTQESTDGIYKYGAYTYFINKDVNDIMLGQPVQVIDFYISDY